MAGETPIVEGIDPKYLQIIPKEDSQSKLAYAAGKDPKYFFTAPEFEVLREYVNSLRDLIDTISNRPEKRIMLSDVVSQGFYIFQPGDENKLLIVENDTGGGTTVLFTIPGNFPTRTTFQVYLADRGSNFAVNYSVQSPGATISGVNTQSSAFKAIAYLRKMEIEPNIEYIITYQVGQP